MDFKVWIFEEVVHEDDEFTHDSGERDFGGFAGGAEPLIKLFEWTVGMSGDEGRHVKGTSDGSAATADAAPTVPLAALARVRGQSGQGRGLAAAERAEFREFGQHAQ